MATLALTAAGAAIGGAVLPAGISVLGTTLTGATIGAQIGAIAGNMIDQSLLGGTQTRGYEGPRLTDLRVTASTEGASIPVIFGRARLGGQVLWASEIEEVVTTEHAGGGGKGFGGGGGVEQTSYTYHASFAVGLCAGEISGIRRVWADNEELDLNEIAFRVYHGTATQLPDSLIVAHKGGEAPAYRDLAYVVFERLPITPFGNRIPQLSFEVTRAVGDLHERIRSVVVIPGSGEFVYATTPVTRDGPNGTRVPDNVHTLTAGTDWSASMDQLQSELPNIEHVSLVTSWFGDDLRANVCGIRPGVERRDKATEPVTWRAAQQTRVSAYLISETDGRPSYGGTPSDQTVVEAIVDLTRRGLKTTLTPFLLMDIPADNTRPDPYSGTSGQSAFPWRGRITTDPAVGQPGAVDQTPAAASQITAFLGNAAISDFSIVNDDVVYAGPSDWGYRRFILHHAFLAAAAGGVDVFVIGTELRGLTQTRSTDADYPFVSALMQLAADVRAVLGPQTKITYAADWSEYFGHQPADGSGDVYFHLDPLWASPDIDAVGIDVYWPLSDWRDGIDHADHATARSIYDQDYLKRNISGGEGYDWYYTSSADRDAQLRTPVSDGGGKPWVFRYKDLAGWWQNVHYDRPAGVESATSTGWVPESKPVWFLEYGCPAVDKGANTPNRFFDPKSSENALPYFAMGRRDDLMQRSYVQAMVDAFDPLQLDFEDRRNPLSSRYGGRMVDPSRMYLYAWDARPFPAFPANTAIWGDTENWSLGHWLNGRLSAASLDAVVAAILDASGFADYDVGRLRGLVPGYVIERIMSARDALQPLSLAYFFDSVESGDQIVFTHRGGRALHTISERDTVEERPGAPLATLHRAQETDLPRALKLRHLTDSGDYRQQASESRRLTGASGRTSEASLPLMLDPATARQIAESWLHETWTARETATFNLPPSQAAFEPGDMIALDYQDRVQTLQITTISDHGVREVETRAIDPEVYSPVIATARPVEPPEIPILGTVSANFLDLPLLRGDEPDTAGYVAMSQAPWPGPVALYRSPTTSAYTLAGVVRAPAIQGVTRTALATGPEGRIDHANTVTIELAANALYSAELDAVLSGANLAAVQAQNGVWEVFQYLHADLIGERLYVLSKLLRAQGGTEDAMGAAISPGAPFVILNAQLKRLDLSGDQIDLPLNWTYGPARFDIGHANYARQTHALQARGRKPYSPVHVRGQRTNGDLHLSWIRRTRIDGDSWTPAAVPIGEAREAYEVDIHAGSAVVRTLIANTPATVYSAADQLNDFGSLQTSVDCTVYQLSETAGRGTGRSATL